MPVAGIDAGGRNIHLVITEGRNLLSKNFTASGINKSTQAESLYDQTLQQLGLKRKEITRVVATGSFGRHLSFADDYFPDAEADALGVIQSVPSARTVLDVGAEEGRAIKICPEGKVLDFAANERCAAGTGTFIDTMARALELSLEEMSKLSLESTHAIAMNAQCAVFGESEVISLIHQNLDRKDIVRAVHDAIAGRTGSLARIVGLEPDIVLTGGLALNQGFVQSLKRALDTDIIVPDNPEYIGAIGAAAATNLHGGIPSD
jgi:benzoyl-CoA reductase subunit D